MAEGDMGKEVPIYQLHVDVDVEHNARSNAMQHANDYRKTPSNKQWKSAGASVRRETRTKAHDKRGGAVRGRGVAVSSSQSNRQLASLKSYKCLIVKTNGNN